MQNPFTSLRYCPSRCSQHNTSRRPSDQHNASLYPQYSAAWVLLVREVSYAGLSGSQPVSATHRIRPRATHSTQLPNLQERLWSGGRDINGIKVGTFNAHAHQWLCLSPQPRTTPAVSRAAPAPLSKAETLQQSQRTRCPCIGRPMVPTAGGGPDRHVGSRSRRFA